MVTGLVLVKMIPGKEKQVLTKLRTIREVVHMSAVFGRWDLVLDMETNDLEQLSEVVVTQIRNISGVLSTETLVTTSL